MHGAVVRADVDLPERAPEAAGRRKCGHRRAAVPQRLSRRAVVGAQHRAGAATASSGRPAAAGGRGTGAMLRAYDGATGKALWDSGTAMTAFASPGSFWSAFGQVYVGTNDSTVHTFGFLDERR